jgi:hypothetical protein
MPLKRFGATAPKQYDFTQTGIGLGGYSDNFANMVPRTVRLPGLDGGFDEFGRARAPSEIGQVRQEVTISAETRTEMDAKRDTVRAMADWGKQRLFMQPTDPALAERWCWARVNNIQISRDEGQQTDLMQRLSIIWQASDPRWYAAGTENTVFWGEGATWGGGAKWGGALGITACSGLSTSISINRSGNATVYPRFFIRCSSSQSCQNPIIQRLNGAEVVDQVAWVGTVAANQTLAIDARGLSVKLDGSNAYAAFSALNPAWFSLLPGSNSLKVLFANSGDAASVHVAYYEGYY